MFNKLLITICFLTLFWFGSNIIAEEDHDHDHENDKTELVNDGHEGHDHLETEVENIETHSDDEDHDHSSESGEKLLVELTPEAAKLAGITLSKVENGSIDKVIELPGEIGFDEDRVAHIAPRFAGIAKQAKFRVGDFVKEGEIVAIIESNESLNSYSIKAPISGWIIERHITTGEFVSEENSIFVIADLSTVWVNLAVYPKDADQVKKGQIAEIKVIGSQKNTSGTISYVTPIVDFHTRSLTARVILPNLDNKWRPGSFVQGKIETASGNKGLIVKKSAVQYLDGKSVVFIVVAPNKFQPLEIKIGDTDQNHAQVLAGLKLGTKYVSKGAFELKAKIVTSNLDAHAGHGH